MPRQNRVTPFGDIIATPERGTFIGNRGVLHDDTGRIRRPWRLKRWIVCALEFKGRKRSSVAAMMELRHLALVACFVWRLLGVGAAAARKRTSPEVWDGPLPDATPGPATPWDRARSYPHDRGSFDTE